MIVRSLERPVYSRKKKGGLAGAGLKPVKPGQGQVSAQSFEAYLIEAFQGEIVQQGTLFSATLSDLMRRNLQKI